MFIAEIFKYLGSALKSALVKFKIITQQKSDEWPSEIVAVCLLLLIIVFISFLK